MIARVRIAPVERWCEDAKKNSGHDLAGRSIRIITESMFQDNACKGKAWVEPREDSLIRAQEINDLDVFRGMYYYICEHMLEMD